MKFKKGMRRELANHLNEVVTLKGKFAKYDKVKNLTTFKKLVNVETGEKTHHINVMVKRKQYDKDKDYYITGVVSVYRDSKDEELFDFGIYLVEVEEKDMLE